MKKAICLNSGGADSATVVALAKSKGFEVYTLYINYGNSAKEKEEECSGKIAEYYGVKEHRKVNLEFLSEIGGSGLVDSSIKLEEENKDLEYVPFRNTILLSLAVAWAEVIRADTIFVGSIGAPWITPDNSPEYFHALREVVKIGTKLKKDIQIEVPFGLMKKVDVIEKGLELNVPYELTWSCHNNTDVACGQCSQCLDRLKAFDTLKAQDPITYISF
ncbi:7-cyano-7-deazaguanine synthase [Bacillus weihaiensis]|uniref:7-cyano-7-deazaguanine synthase n=1 Tax=Bacillus weihaiensis TaxID=1547283 RepID=UPI0023551603|nr:7-cyano-7-deazaguanine synthase [Bacillus weihaiensis]